MSTYVNTEKLFELYQKLPNWYRQMMNGINIDNMSISTKCGYARDVIHYFEWLSSVNVVFNTKTPKDYTLDDLSKITPSDANEYATYLSKYSASTISRRLAAVSSMYVELMRYNQLSKNPFSVVRRPKQKKNVIVYLTDNELERFLNVIVSGEQFTKREMHYHNPYRDSAMFILFLDTGMRLSELVNLNIKDLDLDECSVIVTRKGGKKERLFYSDVTATKLSEWINIKGDFDKDSEALFTNSRGTRMSQKSIEWLTQKYAQIAFPNKHISPHKLRSTFAMNFYAKTHDLLLLQKKMGHSDISTTTIYAEAVQEREKDTRNLLFE